MRDLVFAAPWEGKQRDKSETGKRLRGKFTCRLKVGGGGESRWANLEATFISLGSETWKRDKQHASERRVNKRVFYHVLHVTFFCG